VLALNGTLIGYASTTPKDSKKEAREWERLTTPQIENGRDFAQGCSYIFPSHPVMALYSALPFFRQWRM
jgi:hypothetical protein